MKLTFRDSEETKEHNAIAMCSSNVIVYVTDREMKGPVFIVSSSYRYSSFVTTENYWAKDRAVRFGILSNYVLTNNEHELKEMMLQTYRLFPGPIPRHEITKAMGSISSAFLKWREIEIGFKIRVRQDIMD
jgi:hypothetical protein